MSDIPAEIAPVSESEQARPVEFRGGGFSPKPLRWVGLAVFVVLIALAEIGTRTGFISPLTLPKPSDVLQTFRELWESGLLWKHLIPSLTRLAVGAALGACVGIGVGMLIGLIMVLFRKRPSSRDPSDRTES